MFDTYCNIYFLYYIKVRHEFTYRITTRPDRTTTSIRQLVRSVETPPRRSTPDALFRPDQLFGIYICTYTYSHVHIHVVHVVQPESPCAGMHVVLHVWTHHAS